MTVSQAEAIVNDVARSGDEPATKAALRADLRADFAQLEQRTTLRIVTVAAVANGIVFAARRCLPPAAWPAPARFETVPIKEVPVVSGFAGPYKARRARIQRRGGLGICTKTRPNVDCVSRLSHQGAGRF